MIICCLITTLPARPQDAPETPSRSLQPISDSRGESAEPLTVSVITCWPGKEIYELYGHAAIRIRGERFDSVWNYGVFDFRQPNFVYRFVKGETDYMLAGYPFKWFMPEYVDGGRKVVEQVLNLTPGEAQELRHILQRESLPQNRQYRYNYVKDNCATRILDRIDDASESHAVYPDSVAFGTFRNGMRAYDVNYPWYQFGIDIALGSGIDRPIGSREEMFIPVEMMQKMERARFTDGRPLVKETKILYSGRPGATLDATPWWLTPMTWSLVALLVSIAIAVYDARRRRVSRWWYTLFFSLLGIAGCVVTFLVCFSSHEATSPNSLWIWLNPLQLVMAICVWWRLTRPAALAVAWYNMVVMTVTLIVWPLQNQSANPAFFPLMGSTLILSGAYAIISSGKSYNNRNEQISHIRADKSGRTKHRDAGAGPRRQAKARGRNSR